MKIFGYLSFFDCFSVPTQCWLRCAKSYFSQFVLQTLARRVKRTWADVWVGIDLSHCTLFGWVVYVHSIYLCYVERDASHLQLIYTSNNIVWTSYMYSCSCTRTPWTEITYSPVANVFLIIRRWQQWVFEDGFSIAQIRRALVAANQFAPPPQSPPPPPPRNAWHQVLTRRCKLFSISEPKSGIMRMLLSGPAADWKGALLRTGVILLY